MPISKRTANLSRRPADAGDPKPHSTTRERPHRMRVKIRPSVPTLRAALPANQRWMVAAYGD